MSKRLMVALVVLVFAGTSCGEEPFAKMTFQDACDAAKRDKKIVLIDFYTTWCGPCKRMDKTTWKDKKVIAWMKEKTVALKEYLWCFDRGVEHNPAFAGVRLSFLLTGIHQLSAKLPRAREELEERRDKAGARINAKPKGDDDALSGRNGALMEFVAVNRTLGDDHKTLELYDQLIKQNKIDPAVGRMLLREVSELLAKEKRYADLLKGVGDPKKFVDQEIAQFEQIQTIAKAQARDQAKEVESMMKCNLLENCAPVYESLVGTGQTKQAGWVSGKLIAFDDSADTYVTLIRRAVRAGHNEIARELAASAAKSLEGEDAERVAHAAKEVPGN